MENQVNETSIINGGARPSGHCANLTIHHSDSNGIIAVRCDCGKFHPVRFKNPFPIWDEEYIPGEKLSPNEEEHHQWLTAYYLDCSLTPW